MKKGYYLSSCSTCKRIIKELNLPDSFDLQDIKFEKITPNQLEEMYKLAKSYGALFNKRARNYKVLGLANKNLTEADYKSLILKDYTFLKRPVFIVDGEIFIGNTKAVVEALKYKLSTL
ncbi:MAG: arsenate reductase [Vicingaceae bacterium]